MPKANRKKQRTQKTINAAVRKMRRKIFASDEGTVISVTCRQSTIRFGDGEKAFCRVFPTWRLRIANADEIGARVRHTMSHFRDMVVSRLVRIDKVIPLAKMIRPVRRLTKADYRLLERDHSPNKQRPLSKKARAQLASERDLICDLV